MAKLTPETRGQLHWTDARGGGRMLSGSCGDLCEKLRTLRRPAVLKADGHEDPIGGCERSDGQDDQRIKWNWWCDADAMRGRSGQEMLATDFAGAPYNPSAKGGGLTPGFGTRRCDVCGACPRTHACDEEACEPTTGHEPPPVVRELDDA